jgi:hypothetical protein
MLLWLMLIADGIVFALTGQLASLDLARWITRWGGRVVSPGTLLAHAVSDVKPSPSDRSDAETARQLQLQLLVPRVATCLPAPRCSAWRRWPCCWRR